MENFDAVKRNLENRGFAVRAFKTGAEAAAYLDGVIDGRTVGFGGSVTLDALGLYERLGSHNRTIWHWKWEDPAAARRAAVCPAADITPALLRFTNPAVFYHHLSSGLLPAGSATSSPSGWYDDRAALPMRQSALNADRPGIFRLLRQEGRHSRRFP